MEEVKRIQTIGRAAKIVMLIVSILAFVGAGAMIAGALVFAVVPESFLTVSGQVNGSIEIASSLNVVQALLKSVAEDLSFGRLGQGGNALILDLRAPDFSDVGLTKLIAFGLFALAVQTLLCGIVFVFVSKFGKVLEKNSTPFSKDCIRYLKIAAFVLLGWSVLGSFTDNVFGMILFRRLFSGFSVNVGMILAALILLLVAYIFQYGAKLQRDVDETL